MNYEIELKAAILSENLFETEQILKKINYEMNSINYIKFILEIMEDNPNLDYGMPGPLVHFMETFYKKGYETFLSKSIERKPTTHTLWMVRRILNDTNFQKRKEYIEILNNTLNRNDIDDSIKKEIVEIIG